MTTFGNFWIKNIIAEILIVWASCKCWREDWPFIISENHHLLQQRRSWIWQWRNGHEDDFPSIWPRFPAFLPGRALWQYSHLSLDVQVIGSDTRTEQWLIGIHSWDASRFTWQNTRLPRYWKSSFSMHRCILRHTCNLKWKIYYSLIVACKRIHVKM